MKFPKKKKENPRIYHRKSAPHFDFVIWKICLWEYLSISLYRLSLTLEPSVKWIWSKNLEEKGLKSQKERNCVALQCGVASASNRPQALYWVLQGLRTEWEVYPSRAEKHSVQERRVKQSSAAAYLSRCSLEKAKEPTAGGSLSHSLSEMSPRQYV